MQVIGNGVDLTKFTPVPRLDARRQLGLPDDAEVLVSVGTLVERKGFHRVIECLPGLLATHPMLHFVIVGGAGPEGDMSAKLKSLVRTLGLDDRVHFLGPLPNDRLKVPLSAADVFVLATSYEGWANVFLEAMACGLPVVTTDVGGNAQVVNDRSLGRIVPFGDTSSACRKRSTKRFVHRGTASRSVLTPNRTRGTDAYSRCSMRITNFCHAAERSMRRRSPRSAMLDSVLRAVYSAIAPAGAHARLSTLIFHRVLQAPDPLLPERADRRRI